MTYDTPSLEAKTILLIVIIFVVMATGHYGTVIPEVLARFTEDIPPPESPQGITFANTGGQKVVAQPGDELRARNRTFEPVQTYQKRGALVIYEKRWYFRLVKAKVNNVRRARALMDDYSLNDLSSHVVLCFTPDRIPGRHEPFRNQEGKIPRIYAFFDSYIEAFTYMQKFSPLERAFYEIIFGEFPQKPHFDIDISFQDFNQKYSVEGFDHMPTIIVNTLITACDSVLTGLNLTLNLERDVLIYSSHGPEKRSFHLVLNNLCHDSNSEAKAFFEAVKKNFSQLSGGKYVEFLDDGVYSPRQQFRLLGSQKTDSGRPKIFHPQFTHNGVEYTHIYNEEFDDEIGRNLVEIYESMVGFTSGCEYIPSLVPPKPINHNDLSGLPDIEQAVVHQCLHMLKQAMADCPFTLKEIQGHLILLLRHRPSHCPICHRVHENENPYMFIVGGKLYWDCRRGPLNAKKFLVGYMAVSIEDMKEDDSIEEIMETGGEFSFGDYGTYYVKDGGVSTIEPTPAPTPTLTLKVVPRSDIQLTTNVVLAVNQITHKHVNRHPHKGPEGYIENGSFNSRPIPSKISLPVSESSPSPKQSAPLSGHQDTRCPQLPPTMR